MTIPPQSTMSFKTEFAVEMTCQACVDDVNNALSDVKGLESVDVELEKNRVTVIGRTPPSILCKRLKETGRQVIVRGSGTASGSHEGAAVAILETPLPALQPINSTEESQQVHGIARMVQIFTSPVLMLLDLTVRFPGYPLKTPSAPASGTSSGPSYDVYVSKTGDMQSPPSTTGGVHLPLTTITPDPETGYADAFCELEVPIWEVIGRGMVIELSEDVQRRVAEAESKVKDVIGSKGRLGLLAGVIARSAGAWGNEKTVCACSGKTMFQESRLMESKTKV